MSVIVAPEEVDQLLEHFGIKKVSEKPAGGISAEIEGFQRLKTRNIAVAVGAHRVVRACPISQDDANAMVAQLVTAHALPKDASFDALVKHLIVTFSDLYLEGGVDGFHFPHVHLHHTSYEIEEGRVWRTNPLQFRPRRKHKVPVLHEGFPHQTQARK